MESIARVTNLLNPTLDARHLNRYATSQPKNRIRGRNMQLTLLQHSHTNLLRPSGLPCGPPPEETMSTSSDQLDPEILAMSTIISVLKGLDPDAQSRVLEYVQRKLNRDAAPMAASPEPSRGRRDDGREGPDSPPADGGEDAENGDGIKEVARRWMPRNSLTAHSLGALFSLGVEDIELVANKVPGRSKRERMHNVILLRGVASYLGSGAARFTHADLKETCL